jgi:integrase
MRGKDMPKTRGNNEGAIYEWPEGSGIWYAQLPRDEETGKRPKRRASSKKEAQALLRQMERERDQGLDLSAKKPTIAAFTATWLEDTVKRSVKPSTLAGYETVLNLYVLPRIGNVRIDRLTAQRVQKLINDLADEGYAPRTIKNAYTRLRAMLEVAVDEGLTTYKLRAKVKLPAIDDTGKSSLTAEGALALLALVEKHRLAALYHVYLGLGLRRGEGLGLLWRDFDPEAGTITIRQQVQPIKGKTTVTSPKTPTSSRTLPLPTHLVDLLQRHWENQQEERRFTGVQWKEHGLIFASDVGTPISPRNLNRQFSAFVAKAGLSGITVHTCRHFCATQLGELGAEERVIGAILGHTSQTITAHYAKVTMPMKRTALDSLATLLLRKAA